ncbi:MAG: hypothetical protein K0S07_955 [Chlamydiales bacterium]|jgi:hypothetical protein|nr:hypothetical protein [Chlamydiales bacterium]
MDAPDQYSTVSYPSVSQDTMLLFYEASERADFQEVEAMERRWAILKRRSRDQFPDYEQLGYSILKSIKKVSRTFCQKFEESAAIYGWSHEACLLLNASNNLAERAIKIKSHALLLEKINAMHSFSLAILHSDFLEWLLKSFKEKGLQAGIFCEEMGDKLTRLKSCFLEGDCPPLIKDLVDREADLANAKACLSLCIQDYQEVAGDEYREAVPLPLEPLAACQEAEKNFEALAKALKLDIELALHRIENLGSASLWDERGE